MGLGIRARLRALGLYPELSNRSGVGAWYRREALSAGRTLLGLRENVVASDLLALDVARLNRARELLGESPPPAAVKRRALVKQRKQVTAYFSQRLGECTARDRPATVKAFVAADEVLPPNVRTPGPADQSAQAASVRETGCASLGRMLDDGQVAEIHRHLGSKPLFLKHDAHLGGPQVPSLADVPANQSYACHDYLDLWSSPHILELATQDRLLDIAQGYLGCTPTLYSINAFWSFPNRQPHPYSQLFHRDWEDFRSFIVFTQLTPVDEPQDGAHYYVEGSHEAGKFEATFEKRGIDRANFAPLMGRNAKAIASLAGELFQETARHFDGPAGQSFCTDGYGLHRALVPHSKPRLLLWMRFGNFFNEGMYNFAPHVRDRAAAHEVLRRIPATPRHQYVFRHLSEALSSV